MEYGSTYMNNKMDAKFITAVVPILSMCIGYSQQLQAQKCHYRASLFHSIEHCARDFQPPRCNEGVISVKWVKHGEENCNWSCSSTCCVLIDDYASSAVRRNVIQECNHKESCRLESITFGTAIIQYTCTVTNLTTTTGSTARTTEKEPTNKITTTQSTTTITTADREITATKTVDIGTEVTTTAEYIFTTASGGTQQSSRQTEQGARDGSPGFDTTAVVGAAIGGMVALVSIGLLVIFLLKGYRCSIQRKSSDSNTEMGDRSPAVTTQNTPSEDRTTTADNVAMYEGMVRSSTPEHVYSGIQPKEEAGQRDERVTMYEGMVRPSTTEHVYSGLQSQGGKGQTTDSSNTCSPGTVSRVQEPEYTYILPDSTDTPELYENLNQNG